ncbi:MAG: hypothetical protein HYX93_00890 [Chloroflexi bacterium]|nr:hypothetical protein [Chloroflexota bacterium]
MAKPVTIPKTLKRVGFVIGALIAIGSKLLDVIDAIQLGLPYDAWMLIGLVVFFVATASLVWTPHDVGPASSTSPAVVEDNRISSSIATIGDQQILTPEFLVGLYQGRTTAQGQVLSRPYVGKPLTVTGVIYDISYRWDQQGVIVALDFSGSKSRIYVSADFDHAWVEYLSARQKGETVTITGNVRDITASFVSLRDCAVQL